MGKTLSLPFDLWRVGTVGGWLDGGGKQERSSFLEAEPEKRSLWGRGDYRLAGGAKSGCETWTENCRLTGFGVSPIIACVSGKHVSASIGGSSSEPLNDLAGPVS